MALDKSTWEQVIKQPNEGGPNTLGSSKKDTASNKLEYDKLKQADKLARMKMLVALIGSKKLGSEEAKRQILSKEGKSAIDRLGPLEEKNPMSTKVVSGLEGVERIPLAGPFLKNIGVGIGSLVNPDLAEISKNRGQIAAAKNYLLSGAQSTLPELSQKQSEMPGMGVSDPRERSRLYGESGQVFDEALKQGESRGLNPDLVRLIMGDEPLEDPILPQGLQSGMTPEEQQEEEEFRALEQKYGR